MLRSALAAVVVGIGVMAGGVAAAWTDPAGRVIFDAPRGWAVQAQDTAQVTYVITATGAAECHIVAQPNALEGRDAQRVIDVMNDDAQFDNSAWERITNGLFAPIFPGNSASVISTSKDTSEFWPIRRAEIQGPERVVHVTMQARPGTDILSACMTFGGSTPTATFEALVRSLRHPNDANWETSAPTPAPGASSEPAPGG